MEVCMSNSKSNFELTEADFLRLFVKHEAALRAYARAKGTALDQTCFFGRPQIVEMLLAAGADTETVNFTGLTPQGLIDRRFDKEWKAVYEHTYETLDHELDFDEILRSRGLIKQMFRDRADSNR
jgi:hypothetical protein